MRRAGSQATLRKGLGGHAGVVGFAHGAINRGNRLVATRIPLVLVPGAGCTQQVWEPQTTALADVAEPVIVDNRKDRSVSGLVTRALPKLPDRFALAGLSLGGLIALEFMKQAPERVTCLALLDTQARPESRLAKLRRPLFIVLAHSGLTPIIFGMMWPRLVHKNRHTDQQLKELVTKMVRDTGRIGLAHQQRVFLSFPDYRPLLPKISVPTIVIVGDADTLTPPIRSEEMATAIPGAKLTRIPNCGHLSTLEAPDAVNAAMREWLIANN